MLKPERLDNSCGEVSQLMVQLIYRHFQWSTTLQFHFSRTSPQGSPVLTSRVVIDSVKDSLNGTVVTCMDVTSSTMESSATVIMIINSRIQCMWDVDNYCY